MIEAGSVNEGVGGECRYAIDLCPHTTVIPDFSQQQIEITVT